MATYAVGDIQGCIGALHALLDSADFSPKKDTLWVAGDLVNRGPDSLATLRFIKSLPNVEVVLGNHDLHLLAAAQGFKNLGRKDTLTPILEAEDRDELLMWLQAQPLVHHCDKTGYTMVHAGIPPIWTIEETIAHADEVHKALRSDKALSFFSQMYGNEPDCWSPGLKGNDRLRIITNYLTRMRFCDEKGRLNLKVKTAPDTAPEGLSPWFDFPQHKCKNDNVLFGHWASLQGSTGVSNFIALDTGCVWGGTLTMLRLEDQKYFFVPCDECRISLTPVN
ncbi:MAG: symmetrical bis(5'-nucleosyl)-tetraphosphatase [Agarilytica sp.]